LIDDARKSVLRERVCAGDTWQKLPFHPKHKIKSSHSKRASYCKMFASKAQHLRSSATIKSTNSRHSFKVSARSVNTGIKKTDLKDGKFVFESDTKGRILIQEFMGELYAINNKCPHLGLPLQGKTPLLSATCTKNGGVVCSVHGSGTFAFHIFKTSFHLDQNNRVRFKNRCRVRRVVS
tara:strand:- start:2291 stop:2827 length:537 start_codon:yes stop_codon:yes gene_type:complete